MHIVKVWLVALCKKAVKFYNYLPSLDCGTLKTIKLHSIWSNSAYSLRIFAYILNRCTLAESYHFTTDISFRRLLTSRSHQRNRTHTYPHQCFVWYSEICGPRNGLKDQIVSLCCRKKSLYSQFLCLIFPTAWLKFFPNFTVSWAKKFIAFVLLSFQEYTLL